MLLIDLGKRKTVARPRGQNKTELVSMRISPETATLWELVAKELGVSKVGAFEMAIRKLAKTEGVVLPEKIEVEKETDQA